MVNNAEHVIIGIHFIDDADPNNVHPHSAFKDPNLGFVVGGKMSDAKTLNMNVLYNVNGETMYAIIYSLMDLTKINFKSVAVSLVKLIKSQYPDSRVDIDIYAPLGTDDSLSDKDCRDYASLISSLQVEIDTQIEDNECDADTSMYPDTDDEIEVDEFRSRLSKFCNDYLDKDFDEDGDDPSYNDTHQDEFTYDQLRALGLIDDDDDYEDDGDDEDGDDDDPSEMRDSIIDPVKYALGEYLEKAKGGNIRPSKVLRVSKNPKKSYNRHGIIVCSDKSAIRKDRETIKRFLKEFIPGQSEWKKALRRDLLSRWMKLYTVSNKKMRSLEREFRRANSKDRPRFDAERALEYSRRIFNIYDDNWSNPNK